MNRSPRARCCETDCSWALVFLLLGAGCAAAPAWQQSPGPAAGDAAEPAGTWDWQASALIGGRSLDDDGFGPVDEQFVFGGEIAARPVGSWLGMEGGAQIGIGAHGTPFLPDYSESHVGELYVGARATWAAGEVLRPYCGVGVSLASVGLSKQIGFTESDDRDVTGGVYLHAGVDYLVGRQLLVGFDVRGLFGTSVDLLGSATDADYVQAALTLGLRW
ncbi:MAG: outer membrane beta-barrel protein [Planctomycetes bacterium]|nr:outer membrane beta-barrel protein [Planctomycetota bacterium]